MRISVWPSSYIFNASGKTVTFIAQVPSSLGRILSVVNLTRGKLLFQPQGGPLLTGTWVSPVLTLAASTAGMSNTDELEIWIDDDVKPASEPAQTTGNALLASIDGKLPAAGDPMPISDDGGSITVDAVSLPLPDGAATSAAQDTGNASLSSIDGKLTGVASEATLSQVRDAIRAQIDVANTVWTDNSGAYFVRRDLVNEGTGAITVTFTDPSGNAATPGAGVRPLSTVDRDVTQALFDATAGGTGYSAGDVLARVLIIDANATPAVTTAIWVNLTTGSTISAPTGGTYERADETIGARQIGAWDVGITGAVPLPTNAAQETGGNLEELSLAVGAPADATATTDEGSYGLLALIKRLLTKIPFLGIASPSGSVPVVASRISVTGTASIAPLNTDVITGTASGWYDALGFNYASVVLTGGPGISGGQVTFEWTNNTTTTPNGFPAFYQTNSLSAAWSSAAVAVGANTNFAYLIPLPGRFFRARVNQAFNGGTVQATVTFSNVPPFPSAQNVVIGTAQVPINFSQIQGSAPLPITPGDSQSNRAVGVGAVGPWGTVDGSYNPANMAAASGNGSTLSLVAGPSVGYMFNVTAWNAGSSTGLDLFIEETYDIQNAVVGWSTIWHVEAITGTGVIRTPLLPVGGRRRIRWAHRGGSATTASVQVFPMYMSGSCQRQVQYFDRTAGVGSGTAVLNTVSATYDIAGVNPIVVMDCGTASAVASFQVEMSLTGAVNSWYSAGAAKAIDSLSANRTRLNIDQGVRGKFLRIVCTNAGTSQVINAAHIYGSES